MIKLIKSTFHNEKQTKKELTKFIEKSNILSFNKECQKFEKKFSKYQKRKFSIFVNSGSSANLAMIQALLNLGRLKQGDKVGFSALTWSTNVMPLIQLGLNPIPIDVELNTLNVSSHTLKKTLKNHDLKMIFITNLLGFCDDIDEVSNICKEKEIILLEDNCESLGSVYKGKLLGNFGLASSFSFYVGHHMSTIEGGMITTDDEELATMLRVVRAHGWDRNLSMNDQQKIRKKFKVNSTFYSRYTFYDLGYNLRPTEINGFLGSQQLQFLDEILEKRNLNFLMLADKLYSNKNYYPLKYGHMDFVSNFAVPIICKTKKKHEELIKKCDGKIEIRPIVGGDMTQQPFYPKYQRKVGKFWENSNSKLIHERGLYFGNNPELTEKELKLMESIFNKV
jgi:CDP-4-dehydro-6-deoxyglucose reductase, E1